MQGFRYFECGGFRGWPIPGRKNDGVIGTTLDHINGKRADHQRYYLDVLYQMPFFVSRSLPLHLSDALGNLPSKRIT
jgi:hypothetical protein